MSSSAILTPFTQEVTTGFAPTMRILNSFQSRQGERYHPHMQQMIDR
jgi:hypothetical protein